MSRVLILAAESDTHAAFVSAVLRNLGHDVHRFGLDRFPRDDIHTIGLTADGLAFRSSGNQFDSDGPQFDTVWFRRFVPPTSARLVAEADDDRFVQRLHFGYAGRLHYLLSRICRATRSARWVNPYGPGYWAEDKALQLMHARRAGFAVPKTVITNDPDAVAVFCQDGKRRTICKPLSPPSGWTAPSGRHLGSFSAIFPSDGSVPAESIKVAPAIYQEYVDKQYEIRTVFMGEDHLSVSIDSQAQESTKIDWRASMEYDLRPYRIPETLAQKCRAMMRDLGIVFGCFDFIRNLDGEYVFLEVNQAGQFLFMEESCSEVHVLAAFSHFLANGSLAGWRPDDRSTWAAEVRQRPEIASLLEAKNTFVAEEYRRTGRAVRVY